MSVFAVFVEKRMAMLIDDFTYSMREGDGDIYYTISFSEYRTLNVPSVQITTKVRNNGLLSRPAPAAAGGSYTDRKSTRLNSSHT